MFNVGKYFYKTGTLGTVSSAMYFHIIHPDFYHAGRFETLRVRRLQVQNFRPDGALVKQLKRMHLLEDF